MKVVYKLTEKDHTTYNGCKWGPNVTHETSGEDELCGDGWLHYYPDPYLAVVMNPAHAGFQDPLLWEAKAEGEFLELPDKCGCTKLTTLKIIEPPIVTRNQRIRFAILCARLVCKDKKWNTLANNWLNGKDRSPSAACSAAAAALYAYSSASAAAYAYAAAYAPAPVHAWAAAAVVYAAASAYASASAAAYAAAAAYAYAAAYAPAKNTSINLVELLHQAIAEEGESDE